MQPDCAREAAALAGDGAAMKVYNVSALYIFTTATVIRIFFFFSSSESVPALELHCGIAQRHRSVHGLGFSLGVRVYLRAHACMHAREFMHACECILMQVHACACMLVTHIYKRHHHLECLCVSVHTSWVSVCVCLRCMGVCMAARAHVHIYKTKTKNTSTSEEES